MRKIIMMMAMVLSMNVMAQSAAENLEKERARLNYKAIKKEVKQLKKEGWHVVPGGPSMEIQLEESYLYERAKDNNMDKLYYIGLGQSTGKTFNTAHLGAKETARVVLAGQVGSLVSGLTKVMVSNKQLSQSEAESIDDVISKNKMIYMSRLGRVDDIFVVSREKENGNIEVLVRMVASAKSINDLSKTVLMEELKKRGVMIDEQIEKLLK